MRHEIGQLGTWIIRHTLKLEKKPLWSYKPTFKTLDCADRSDNGTQYVYNELAAISQYSPFPDRRTACLLTTSLIQTWRSRLAYASIWGLIGAVMKAMRKVKLAGMEVRSVTTPTRHHRLLAAVGTTRCSGYQSLHSMKLLASKQIRSVIGRGDTDRR